MCTVACLGVTGTLAKTLRTANPIESMISIARTTTGNVQCWCDGEMRRRWCAAGMLEAEQSLRRVRGHTQMPALVAQIRATPSASLRPKTTPSHPARYWTRCMTPGTTTRSDINRELDIVRPTTREVPRMPRHRRLAVTSTEQTWPRIRVCRVTLMDRACSPTGDRREATCFMPLVPSLHSGRRNGASTIQASDQTASTDVGHASASPRLVPSRPAVGLVSSGRSAFSAAALGNRPQ